MFLPVLRGKLMRLFISGNWRKCWKSLSLNFGGKLSKVLRVHNSKQITEETLINDIFFCLFQRRNWGFHQNEIKWLNSLIGPENSSEFQQIELALVFNIKEAFFLQSAVLFDIKRKTTTKNHLYWWCVKRMLRFDTNNINEECTLKM